MRAIVCLLAAPLVLALLDAAPAAAQPPPPPPSYEPTPPPPPPPPRRRRQPPPPPAQPQPAPAPAPQPYPYGGGYGNQSYTPVPSTGTPQEPGQPAPSGAQPYPAPYQAPSGGPTYQAPPPGGRAAPDANYPQAGGFYAPPPPPAPPPEYDVREVSPYASARPPAPPPPYHSGFYGRAMFGGGYTLVDDDDHLNMFFGTGIGVFLIENFALHLEGFLNVSGFMGFGPGLTYIVTPIDLTLSASFMASWVTHLDALDKRHWSDLGPGGELFVGKQFRLNNFLGIGFGGAFHLAQVALGGRDQTAFGFNLGVVGTIH